MLCVINSVVGVNLILTVDNLSNITGSCHGHDRMVVGFTTS
jgi:hypothetical protein